MLLHPNLAMNFSTLKASWQDFNHTLPLCTLLDFSNALTAQHLTKISAYIVGVALAGILVVLHACLDMKALLAGKHAHLLYALTPAMRPRMLLTLDSEGQLLPVPVRVGQAVDVVAQVRPLYRLGLLHVIDITSLCT